MSANGTTIKAWLNGGNELEYGSATFNQTVEDHGLRLFYKGSPTVPTANDFAAWGITGYNDIDNYG